MAVWVAIFLGGGLGAVARYGIGRLVFRWFPVDFPLGTLLANVLATALLGWVVLETHRRGAEGVVTTFLTVGFCGGFSTFSTFSYETMALLSQGRYLIAAANVVLSVVVCLGILYVLSKRFVS